MFERSDSNTEIELDRIFPILSRWMECDPKKPHWASLDEALHKSAKFCREYPYYMGTDHCLTGLSLSSIVRYLSFKIISRCLIKLFKGAWEEDYLVIASTKPFEEYPSKSLGASRIIEINHNDPVGYRHQLAKGGSLVDDPGTVYYMQIISQIDLLALSTIKGPILLDVMPGFRRHDLSGMYSDLLTLPSVFCLPDIDVLAMETDPISYYNQLCSYDQST